MSEYSSKSSIFIFVFVLSILMDLIRLKVFFLRAVMWPCNAIKSMEGLLLTEYLGEPNFR